ncbi:hypothetical protein RDABS01_037216 [Bienertia sinuspersici]
MEGLEEKLKGLEMTEDEEEIIDCIEEDETIDEQLQLCLVGKLLTNNPFSFDAMKNTLKISWHLGKGMIVREIENNMFIFQFFSMPDKRKVMEEGPWSFSGVPISLKEVNEGVQPSEITFETIRVDIKLDKPLKRFTRVEVKGGSKLVKFTYERLMDICHACERLGHGYQQCDKYDDRILVSELPYGNWMKASPNRKRNFGDHKKEEEKKICQEFKGELVANKTRKKLDFDNHKDSKSLGFDALSSSTSKTEAFTNPMAIGVGARKQTMDGEPDKTKLRLSKRGRIEDTMIENNGGELNIRDQSVSYQPKENTSNGARIHNALLGFKNGVFVDSMGRAGGLTLLWNDDIEVNLRSMNTHHIDAMIGSSAENNWRLTGIYVGRWGHQENFDEILKGVWGNARNMGLGDWNESVRICGEQLKKWDANLFLPIDVGRISKIPISTRLPEDTVCWVGSKDGIFKVKDAYKLAMNHENAATSSSATTFHEWLAWIFEQHNRETSEFFAMVAWQIWKCRNDDYFNSSFTAPELAKGRVNDLLKEYRRARVKAQDQRARNGSKWSPPPNAWNKINFDAGVNKEFNRVRIGVVASALELAKAQGWSNIIVEGDALNIIKALQGQTQRSSYVQATVEDALALVSSFNDVKFNFCFRGCNEVAHRMAKWAVTAYSDKVWLGEDPNWISDVVVSNISLLT